MTVRKGHYQRLKRAAKRNGLEINTKKTKYMILRIGSQTTDAPSNQHFGKHDGWQVI